MDRPRGFVSLSGRGIAALCVRTSASARTMTPIEAHVQARLHFPTASPCDCTRGLAFDWLLLWVRLDQKQLIPKGHSGAGLRFFKQVQFLHYQDSRIPEIRFPVALQT